MVEVITFTLPHGRGQIAAKHWFKDQSGMPILAVHGWLDNAATFDRCFPDIKGHPIYAMDLAGHGLSSHRAAGMRYHNAEFLDDILAVMDVISPTEPIILLGHSLGAGLLMLMAALFPQRVSKLVLIEGLGPLSANPADIVSQTRDAMLRYQQLSTDVRPIKSIEVATQARMQGMTGALSRDAAQLLLQRGIRQQDDGSYVWSTDKRLRLPSLMRFSEEQVVSFIQAITAPALLIMGDKGMLAMAASSPQYAARIGFFKSLQQVNLSGGHHLHLDESPRQVAQAINAFLDSKA
ncbi:MAG: alpha/beta hydrolase [Moraxellaceae bacterium]|nr:alpha/beta hydrolase [Moraxellaceae bacterium]MDZ4386968.1 alpha/beta hydrolase [Moraxellaceae bacterium]